MRVLTFGWDYPPIRNGGLGVACQGLTEELIDFGVEVVFVLPREQPTIGDFKFLFAQGNNLGTRSYEVHSHLLPYKSSNSLVEMFLPGGKRVVLKRSILEEVYRYAEAAREIARNEHCDVIHAHDWTSYLAGVAAKEETGKPLMLHVHATSFDQAGGGTPDPEIYKIEQKAFNIADVIVAVSNFTKNLISRRYHIDPRKIEVVHNGIKPQAVPQYPHALAGLKAQGKKIVYYQGRITIQKGVDYFVRAARRVIDADPNVIFVISGSGDMEHQIIHLVGSLGISDHVIFTGALWEEERDRMYQSADLFVMPSVSEPFGIVPLEALQHGTPVLVSKQSGVAEVLTHALKVDFWDIDEMANKMLAALRYDTMSRQLVTEGQRELSRITWRRAAEKVRDLYHRLMHFVRKHHR
jgi:glycogen synthase